MTDQRSSYRPASLVTPVPSFAAGASTHAADLTDRPHEARPTRSGASDPSLGQEASVQRWGGLAAVAGSILFIVVFAIVIAFVMPEPMEAEGRLARFAGIHDARVAENGLYLAVLALWIPSFIALYRTTRRTSLAAALFGSALGILGLGVVAVSSLPHIATAPISDLYHAAAATPDERAALVLIWQTTEAIFEAMLLAGLVLVSLGLTATGVAMLRTPAFGVKYGVVGLLLGTAGTVATTYDVIAGPSPVAAIAVLGFIAFHLVVGTKLYRLSRLPRDPAAGVSGVVLEARP